MTIYALKGDPEWADTVLQSLRRGVGRFGWSYMQENGRDLGEADLRQLKTRIDTHGWTSLTGDEQNRYMAFLLEIKPDDWVVYINVPTYGRCTLARVTGGYQWINPAESDFNHCFSVDPQSIYEFDRNDEMVHPALSARLKLRGRFWRIYLLDEFSRLRESLAGGAVPRPRTPETNLAHLSHAASPLLRDISRAIQNTHPNYAFETLLEAVFRKIPGVREVKLNGGAGDHGADLIVEFEAGLPHPALQSQQTCVVQAKSFVGEHWDVRAVEDIRRAFDRYPAADIGLIVSTADSSTPQLDAAIEQLRTASGKRVELLIGADVAKFLLRFLDI